MKLRIRGNSIRLRLTQKEIEQFAATGKVEEKVEFGASSPSQELNYALEKTEEQSAVGARFAFNRLTILIPAKEAREWTESGQIGIEAVQTSGANKRLRILIEKDFA